MSWLQAMDVSLFRFINDSLSNPLFDVLMPWMSGNRLFVPGLLFLVGIVIWRGRWKGVLFLLLLALAIGVTDGLVCNTLKHFVGRSRPCIALENVHLLVGCSDTGSMPSSHAGIWFSGTMVAFLFQRRTWRVMLPLAMTVGFSRIYNGVHYPSDVLAGAILGAATGFAVIFGLNGVWWWGGRKWFPIWYERLPSLLFGMKDTLHVPDAKVQTESVSPELNQHWLRAGYVLIVVLTLARLGYVASSSIELSEDEAYQWVWSKHLALSYYSKPLLIACTQWLGTTLWGDTAFGVRFFSPLIAAVIGVLLLRFFAREVNARAGYCLVLIVTATPLLAVGSTVLTVDPLAVLFWTAAMLSGWSAVQENSRTSAWLWTGLWMGLGFLSKYSSPLLWMCWAVFFIVWPPARQQLRRPGPYLALLINLLCTLPVLIWNAQHDWISLRHVASHGGVGKVWVPTLKYFFEFIGAEFVLLNPWFFVGAMIALVAMWRMPRRDGLMVFFFCMGAPVFLLYVLLSLKSRVQPNWIAPAVLPMFCVMVLYLESRLRARPGLVKLWLTSGLVFGLTLVPLMLDTNLIAELLDRPLPAQIDPLRRVRGYSTLAGIVAKARARLALEGKPVFIIADHYGVTSLLTFYTPEARQHVKDSPMVFCQPSERPSNQYYFWPTYTESRFGQNALFVRALNLPKLSPGWFSKWWNEESVPVSTLAAAGPPPEWLTRQFESVTSLGRQNVLYDGRVLHNIEIFECRNLR